MERLIDTRGRRRTLSELSLSEMQSLFEELGQPKFRAGQVHEWLWKHLATEIEGMTNLDRKSVV